LLIPYQIILFRGADRVWSGRCACATDAEAISEGRRLLEHKVAEGDTDVSAWVKRGSLGQPQLLGVWTWESGPAWSPEE
jgi:hypothetical protein